MPTITVNENHQHLFYEDTGVPPEASQAPYTTLIVVHGTSFHGAVFRRLKPLAPQYGIRLVLVNRRDYPGSSPFSEDDLNKIKTPDEDAHTEFGKNRAVEFANFIKTFVEKENIPQASPNGKEGGVVLLAWSSGVMYTLPLFAHADSILKGTLEAIEPYLRSFIIFDTARWVLGLPPHDNDIKMLHDNSISLEERARLFNEAVASYYKHASVTSRNVKDLQMFPVRGSLTSTIGRMTKEELEEVTCPEAVPRSEIPARSIGPVQFAERVRRALYDDEMAKFLPKCKVDVVWCEYTAWAMVDAAWALQIAREKADGEGIIGRPMRIFMIPGANHFSHWDMPEETMKFLANVIST